MTITIDFDSTTEAQLAEAAQREGVDLPTLVRKLVADSLPQSGPKQKPAIPTPENDATLALLQGWIEKAPTDPAEIAEAEEDLNQFMRNMNEERKRAGARILYPEVE